MVEKNLSVESRLDQLQSEVRLLQEKVEELTQLVQPQSSMFRTVGRNPSGENLLDHPAPDLLHGQSVSTVLSNVATVCFLLVIALVLRTIVDSGLVNRTLGTMIGMGYSTLLVAFGFLRFSKSRANIPVYSTCGILLLFSIVFESYTRFQSLSAATSYGVLAATLVVMTVMGLRFELLTPLFVGIGGSVVVGLALGFPQVHFPFAAGLCFLGHLAAFRSSRVHGAEPLKTLLVLVTVLFFIFWVTKLGAVIPNAPSAAPGLNLFVFSLAVFLFFGMYLVHNLSSALADPSSFSTFEWNLVVLNGLGAFLLYRCLGGPFALQPDVVGTIGLGLGLLHLVLAVVLGFRKGGGREAVTPFVLSAFVLLGWSLTSVSSHVSIAVLGWSTVALAVSLMGAWWDNTRVLLFAALVQLVGCGMVAYSRMLGVFKPIGPVQTAILCCLAALALGHYILGRRNLSRLSENDWLSPSTFNRSLVLVLAAGCVYAFAILRKALFVGVASIPSLPEASFACGQSILINTMALVLMFTGLKLRNGQVVGIGFLAAGAGAAKVFGYDFWNLAGVPIVLGVLSFAITAALGSLVWRKWQQEEELSEAAVRQETTLKGSDNVPA